MQISRREALALLLGAPLAAEIALSGCGAPASPRVVGTLVEPTHAMGHLLRGDLSALAHTTSANVRETRVRTVILGGGVSGLAAGWHLARRGERDFRVVELEDEVGGTATSGKSRVTEYPWGAHYVPLPLANDEAVCALFSEMGVFTSRDDQGDPIALEESVVREPEERCFYRGFWYPGTLPRVAATPRDRAELARFDEIVARYVAMRDVNGKRVFTIPTSQSGVDSDARALDAMSAAAFLDREGIRSPGARWLLEYGTRDDYGTMLRDTSAWALIFYNAARIRSPGEESRPLVAWPSGNGALVKHLAKRVGNARILRQKLVVDVTRDDRGVVVTLLDATSRAPERILAERAIVALPKLVTRRVVRDLRGEAGAHLDSLDYGAWLVANIHLKGRPNFRGYTTCWDNVLYDSPSLGYVVATHQRGSDHGPTVWSYYLPFTDEHGRDGRRRLFAASHHDLVTSVLADLRRAHPDLDDHVERVDVCRWGHAMVRPKPGTIFGEHLAKARRAIGPIHFAHSDLSGLQLFEEAVDHGVRAANEVLAAYESRPASEVPA